ncbi:purine-nucleoside phosphorylase [Solimonas marina]|uniref:Purine nucleoside permease n=1 Tax=Solimonas marina TaxID=2714601 RepID=A0A970B6A3_9GAMM|nr:purine nucleoside permease [Solimonas marina]NKF24232.1 purine nucleoside permease [Solimonas marina]
MSPKFFSRALAFAVLLGLCSAASAAQPAIPPPAPPEARIPVRMVVVANFENGADEGDKPGEYQFWVEREHLDQKIGDVRGMTRGLRRNDKGLYGLLLRDLEAFVLDPRFDLSKTYWLFTGISGVDPHVASVGSAAWARWVVDGDELREIDARELPKDWPYGLFAIGAMKPDTLPTDANSFGEATGPDDLGMAYPINPSFVQWAYALTKNVKIPDTPALAEQRKAWKGFPNAQKPPFVLLGETLGSKRYWHGPLRTKWAEDWVKLWTRGQGRFVMTNMESQDAAEMMKKFGKLGFVDPHRVLVLRTASNPSMPPPGVDPLATVGDEAPGQVAAYEANYRVGAPVVHEILDHWDRYADHIPGTPAAN